MDDIGDLFKGLIFLCFLLAVVCYSFWVVLIGAWLGFGRFTFILALIIYGVSSTLISVKSGSMFLGATTVLGIIWGFVLSCVWSVELTSSYVEILSWWNS